MTNDEVLEDFKRRWNHSYVWLKMKQKTVEVLAYIQDVEYDENKIGVIHLDSSEYGSITINLGSADHDLSFKYPPAGVFQYHKVAALFRRRPQRQWKRGICKDNSHITSTLSPLIGNVVPFNTESIQSAFKHQVYGPTEAMTLLANNMAKSVALGDNFSVSLPITKEGSYLISHWDRVVAECNAVGRIEKVHCPVLDKDIQRIMYGN